MNYKEIDWQDIYDSACVIQRASEYALMAGINGNPKLTIDEVEDIIATIQANVEDIQNDTDDILFEDYDDDESDDD